MNSRKDVSRRKFLKIAGLAGSGSALTAMLVSCSDDTASPTAAPTAGLLTGTTTAVPAPSLAPVSPPPTLPAGEAPDSYLMLAPALLRAGLDENLSITLFKGEAFATDKVQVELLKGGQRVAGVSGMVKGRANLSLPIPQLADGEHTLNFQVGNFRDSSPVNIKRAGVLLVDSDKPVYQPGQRISLRILSLNAALLPQPDEVTVEIVDSSAAKIFKKAVTTNEYGLADLEMPLSTEPNLGTWKVTTTAKADNRRSQLELQVEKYVLPKFEITLSPAKNTFQVGEKITGTIKAEYTFGKPVNGEFLIKVKRYTSKGEELATLTRTFEGQGNFELPAPAAPIGQNTLKLEVTVTEKATGYTETANQVLSIGNTAFSLKVVPEGPVFKPGLPMQLLVLAEKSDKTAVQANVRLDVAYTRANSSFITNETGSVQLNNGAASVQISPPADAMGVNITARSYTGSGDVYSYLSLQAAYSPSGAYVMARQTGQGILKVGDMARFKLASNKQPGNFYYEVTAQGGLVTSGFSASSDLELVVTPRMASTARLLVYQVLAGGEVVADYLPFKVEAAYPQAVTAAFNLAEVEPGKAVNLDLKTNGPAMVGLALVDRAVFILGENRLNIAQVLAEVEKLSAQPRFEITKQNNSYNPYSQTVGTEDLMEGLGMVVLSNKTLPKGKQEVIPAAAGSATTAAATTAAATIAAASTTAAAPGSAADSSANQAGGLAEVQRVRQFFPETWLWETALSSADGKISKKLNTPDSITTWMLQAVAISPRTGLGMAQAELKVFQPFFVSVDLPYSVIRGERFPVKIAVYNYTDKAEDFVVELERGDWFDLLEKSASQTVKVGPSDLAGVSFTIQPRQLGTGQLKVTARSTSRADAVVKDLLVEPEGVAREEVQNVLMSAGNSYEVDLSVPAGIVAGSARARLALTGSYMTQTIEGLEKLIQMPYGCGEQNMILFAPNVYVSQYLKETGQAKPEVLARAQTLMVTGYQRELTYRRSDASFSAFGNQDQIGSLWLSAFVLRTFAQARAFIYIDENVLSTTQRWLLNQQKADGSFEPVGFVHHQDLLGGLKGKTALTAYLATALLESGDSNGAAKAIAYLEKVLPDTTEVYPLALGAYALQLGKSSQVAQVTQKLLALARTDNDTFFWGESPTQNQNQANGPSQVNGSAIIETTGYALMVLLAQGDRISAGKAARFLVGQRNALGGGVRPRIR